MSGWHITLCFIGDTSDAETKSLIMKANEKKWPKKFDIVLDRLGAFPEPTAAKFLWCGTGKNNTKIKQLAKEISYLAVKIKSEKLIPHLTLSRLQDVRP